MIKEKHLKKRNNTYVLILKNHFERSGFFVLLLKIKYLYRLIVCFIVNCKIIMQLFANLGIYIKQFFMCYL